MVGWKTFLLGPGNFSGATLIFEGVPGVSIVSSPKLLHLEEINREDFRYQSPSVLFRSFLSPRRHFHPPAIAGGAVTCATEERKTEQFLSINLVFVGFIQDISGRIPFISVFNFEMPHIILPWCGNIGDVYTGR